MKILLKKDVTNLGYAGEVMDVADGYGRNYLIPQGLAVKATGGVLKEADVWRQRAAVRVTEIRKEHEALSGEINNTRLVFTARAGDSGKLYGSVTTAEIVDKLNEQLGTDVDRRIVSSPPLRQLGEHRVTVKLGRDFHPQVTVTIHPLEVAEEEADEVDEIEAEMEMEGAVDIDADDAATEDDTPVDAEIEAAADEADVEQPIVDLAEDEDVDDGDEADLIEEDPESAA